MKKSRTFSNPEEAREYLRSLGQQLGASRSHWVGKLINTLAKNIPTESSTQPTAKTARRTRTRWRRPGGVQVDGEPISRSYQDPVIQPGDSSVPIFELLLVLLAIGGAIYLLV